jgi:hypothetical protein
LQAANQVLLLFGPIENPRWPPAGDRTMLNLCGIVVANLKMATGRNFSMSGINSRHHNVPTYEMALKSDNVETAKIQHCPISSQFDMWVDNDVPN